MKLLATDYDGTLFFGDQIMKEDIEAIHRWKDMDNLFCLVTGRSIQAISEDLDRYDLPVDYLVTNNGAMIFDHNMELLSFSTLDTITCIDLMYAAHEIADVASYCVMDQDNRYKIEVDPSIEDHCYGHLDEREAEFDLMNHGDFIQLVFSMRNEDAAKALAEKIREYFGNSVSAFNAGYAVFVVPKNTDKGTAVQFVCAYEDIDEDDVFVMGSSYNDLPMIQSVINAGSLATAPSLVLKNSPAAYPSIESFIDAIID